MGYEVSFMNINMQIIMTTNQWPYVVFTESWGMAAM